MKILIVDDERLARQRLMRLLDKISATDTLAGGAEIQVDEAENGAEALKKIQDGQPDIVLLDISMPEIDGMDVAAQLKGAQQSPKIIFTTAFPEHALAAFEVNASDYLLKPIRQARLAEALGKVASQLEPGSSRHQLTVKHLNQIILIPLEDVYYFAADNKYVQIWHHKGNHLLSETLKSLEEEFADDFVRIHRNSLANKKYIRGLEKTGSGNYRLMLDGVSEPLDISRRMVATVKQIIQTL